MTVENSNTEMPIVRMRGIEKSFGGIRALKGVDLDIHRGEVHVVLGENGAGKSTLMKVLSGIHAPTAGEIAIDGETHAHLTPAQAAAAGISIIYQELSVINELSALENLFVGRLPVRRRFLVPTIDWQTMEKQARAILGKLGLDIDLGRPVAELPMAHRQILEIAKSLMGNVRVLVMDEPTSSLTKVEIDRLLTLVRQLRGEGMAILFISHKFDEVRAIGDRFSVLKDGSSNGSGMIADHTNDDLIRMMVGRVVQQKFLSATPIDRSKAPVLTVSNVTSADRTRVRNVGFEVHHGEVFGFAGLIGSGRTELMNCLFGAEKVASGTIVLNGKDITPKSPLQALKSGMAYITESRRQTGFMPNFSILENTAVSARVKHAPLRGTWGFVSPKADRMLAETESKRLAVKSRSVDQLVTELSGGNQQKVLIGKWMATDPEVFIFDEPTRGIDVGAKAEIYAIIRKLADDGKAVIVVSSELPEILAICDRIAVFRGGSIAGLVDGATANEATLLQYAIGGIVQ
ncbi:sugar ABC transporter ATP-binding protein [Rhizobium leguminosarum]|uniref:sugar ABC transporter ATP-binding protein n=1 Tax=Rhizobium leguminosarum TaxID=384 RepID=UPI0015B8E431|nr:ATP-binding cassette domain-containing protein [Rhizobium leguminosarum]MBY5825823.1 ATP-binding cassette domain-containing protein [Rhizobium leguminosarum]